MLVPRTIRAVDSVQLARASGMGRMGRVLSIPEIPRPTLISQQLSNGGCACHGGGLGFVDLSANTPTNDAGNYSVLGAVSTGMMFIPGVGQIGAVAMSFLSSAISAFESWLGIGSGRREADVIVPRQNDLMARLDPITDLIRVGSNPSLSQLDAAYREVWQMAVGFMEFVSMRDFTDRRASGQALNTVMPFINGTCGYPEPLPLVVPLPSRIDCLNWGAGTIGGDGSNGMLGAIGRAIQNAGGTVPQLPGVVTAANDGIPSSGGIPPGGVITAGFATPLAVGLGVLALFMLSRKKVF